MIQLNKLEYDRRNKEWNGRGEDKRDAWPQKWYTLTNPSVWGICQAEVIKYNANVSNPAG